jgi:uroporphyrinogen-III synthase
MPGSLEGLRVLVPETRELDLFASMLEAEGAAALRCPLVRILDLDDTAAAEAWIDALTAGQFQDVVWLTGEGLRRLLDIAERKGDRAAFVGALGRVRSITRGPKPARALRELGYTPGLAPSAPTSQGVVDALAHEAIAGRTIGVQLYPGADGLPLLTALRGRGALLFPVTPYRYAPQADAGLVANAIRDMVEDRIHMVAFTSSPQVDRLVEVAREEGLEEALRQALGRIIVAAVGPVVEERLHRHGVTHVHRPDSSFHLKPFVRAIAASWTQGEHRGEGV